MNRCYQVFICIPLFGGIKILGCIRKSESFPASYCQPALKMTRNSSSQLSVSCLSVKENNIFACALNLLLGPMKVRKKPHKKEIELAQWLYVFVCAFVRVCVYECVCVFFLMYSHWNSLWKI